MDRLTALGHLGVEIYFPRRSLPNAASSILTIRAATEKPLTVTPSPEPRVPVIAERIPSLAAVPQLEARREKKAGTIPPAVAPRKKPAPQSAVYFNLLLAVSSTGLIFVSDIKPRELPPARERSVQQFLNQVLFALGRGTGESGLKLSYFPWPTGVTPGGPLAAKDVLAGLVGRELKESKAAYLILMGDVANEYVTLASGVLPGKVEVLRTPSLGKIFARPALKRELWHTLQPAAGLVNALEN